MAEMWPHSRSERQDSNREEIMNSFIETVSSELEDYARNGNEITKEKIIHKDISNEHRNMQMKSIESPE